MGGTKPAAGKKKNKAKKKIQQSLFGPNIVARVRKRIGKNRTLRLGGNNGGGNNKKTAPAKRGKQQQQQQQIVEIRLPASPHSVPILQNVPWKIGQEDCPSSAEQQLDGELDAFADYVRLTEEERSVRGRLVARVRDAVAGAHPDRSVGCDVFGSFAVRDVCAFHSDVDVALSGIAAEPVAAAAAVTTASRATAKNVKKKEGGPKPSEAAQERQNRISRWKEALAAVDAANEIANGHGGGSEGEEKEGTNAAEEKDGEGRNRREEEAAPSTVAVVASKAATTSELSELGDSDDRDDDGDESDVDSADCLERLSKQTLTVSTSAHLAERLTSSSSDDEETDGVEENDDDDDVMAEQSDMEVSWTASQAPSLHGRERREVVEALRKVSHKLRKCKWTNRVQLIQGARVPIIKVATVSGVETDIAVAGYTGTDTDLYAARQVERFQSFSTVVLFLKVLLQQQGLDTPFTGGLGSYKLYVLVAYHLHRHLALGGADRPGQVLLSFLFRYGGCLCEDDYRTPLDQDVPLMTDEGAEADLSNVFQLGTCVQLFHECWKRLWSRMKQSSKKMAVSLLAEVIDAKRLRKDRKASLSKIRKGGAVLTLLGRQPTKRRAESPVSASPPEQPSTKKQKAASPVSPEQPRDQTREEILAGYGVTSGDVEKEGLSA